MIDPDVLEIDLDSPDGTALLAAVRHRHGEGLVRAAEFVDQIFLLRSPWAPGLRAVGGAIRAMALGARPDAALNFPLIGGGESLEDAFAACIGEGVERASCVEHAGDIVPVDRDRYLPSRVLSAAREPISHLLERSDCSVAPAWQSARLLDDGTEVLVPADWCLWRSSDGPLRMPATALSTGVAAGPTYQEAAARALLELVERDAAALWWIGGRRGRLIAYDDDALLEASRLLSSLRMKSCVRRSWLLDITTDLMIPSVAALSIAETGRELSCGLASRATLREAARAAILEMCQMELGLIVAITKQATETHFLTEADRRHLARANAIDANRCELLYPCAGPQGERALADRNIDALGVLRNRLSEHGIDAALVDLTRERFSISVVRAISPQLQPMPGGPITARLADTIAVSGGGARWTGGTPLF